jgi:hypothetical protein
MPHFPPAELRVLVETLSLATGHVLDLSHAQLRDLVRAAAGVDLDEPVYNESGGSKAKRFRAFLRLADAPDAAAVLTALSALVPPEDRRLGGPLIDYMAIISRLQKIGPRPGQPAPPDRISSSGPRLKGHACRSRGGMFGAETIDATGGRMTIPVRGTRPDHPPAMEESVEDEVLEWYRMTPQERWAESMRLWHTFLAGRSA